MPDKQEADVVIKRTYKVSRLLEVWEKLESLAREGHTGPVTINFHLGGVRNMSAESRVPADQLRRMA